MTRAGDKQHRTSLIVLKICNPMLPLLVEATAPETQTLDEEGIRQILVGTYGEDGALDETLDAISTRMEESNQTVMLKTIVVLHRVLRDGNAPAGHTSKLAKVMAQERSLPSHWTDATIITSYCRYIALRLSSTFLQGQEGDGATGSQGGGIDASVGRFRHLDMDELLEEMPKLQEQLGALLECQGACCGGSGDGADTLVGLDRDVVSKGFALLMKDAFSLHRCASEGVVNLLEKFFSLERAAAMQGIELYKKFMAQTDAVIQMHLKTQQLGQAATGPYPTIQPAPPSLLSALEEYINQISADGQKIEVTADTAYDRDAGAFAGMSGLGSLGGGSFALSAKQLDQVLIKIEKMERAVRDGTTAVLKEKASSNADHCAREVGRLEGEVAERQKALDALKGGFFGFGKKKDPTEVEREKAAQGALDVAQGELKEAMRKWNEAKASPIDALRADAEERVLSEIKELKELVVQVAAAANDEMTKLQVKADALEASKAQ